MCIIARQMAPTVQINATMLKSTMSEQIFQQKSVHSRINNNNKKKKKKKKESQGAVFRNYIYRHTEKREFMIQT
jgi:hypothetical protein